MPGVKGEPWSRCNQGISRAVSASTANNNSPPRMTVNVCMGGSQSEERQARYVPACEVWLALPGSVAAIGKDGLAGDPPTFRGQEFDDGGDVLNFGQVPVHGL